MTMLTTGAAPAPAPSARATDGKLEETESPLEAVRAADLGFAEKGFRLTTANARLCDRVEPAIGVVFQSLSAYEPKDRATVMSGFGFETDIGVEAVIPGSPAEQVGIVPDESLVAIDGVTIDTSLPRPDRKAGTRWVVAVHGAIATLPPTEPMMLTLRRNGRDRQVKVMPVAACRSRHELLLDGSSTALSNGDIVQIGSGMIERYGDDVVAAIAHELAHNVLRHRARMDALGIGSGVFSSIGPDVPYYRRTETEADILSVFLMANAGYDLAIVPRLWRAMGPRRENPFNARTHPRWQDRVATMEKAIAMINAEPGDFHLPALLATRDKPLSKDWAAILVKAKR